MMIAFLLFIFMGACAGFLAGLFGIGGGIILVPGLYYTLNWLYPEASSLMQVSVGTALGTIIVTGISSVRAHYKRGGVRTDLIIALAPGIILGAAFSAFVADQMPSEGLKLFFSVMICFLAMMMVIGPERIKDSGGAWPATWTSNLCGVVIGFVSGLMGIGGATLSVPYMSYYKTDMKQAVGTASALGLFIAIPAAASFIVAGLNNNTNLPGAIGYFYVPGWFGIILMTVLTVPLGVRLAHNLDHQRLRRIFAVFMMVIACTMIGDALF